VPDLFSLSQYGEIHNECLLFDAAFFLMSLADFREYLLLCYHQREAVVLHG